MNLTETIKSVILSNLQPKKKQRIGIEVETLLYDKTGSRIPTNPGKLFSAVDLLNRITNNSRNDSTCSLEPGGQLEWASRPALTLHELDHDYQVHKKRIEEICSEQKLIQSDLALEPKKHPKEIELINIKKYQLMHDRFLKTGQHGPWMMKNTTSVQINLDFESEEEAEEIAFIADCLQPICSILFSNSPFIEGESAKNRNLRYTIWEDTDPTRCGSLLDHNITKPQNLIDKYSEYIQTVPALFVKNEKGGILKFNGTLGAWLERKKKKGDLTEDDIMFALHQIFTHVRFKNVIEIRGADRPPFGFELAPAAFWLGLTSDRQIRENIFDMIINWTPAQRKSLNEAAKSLNAFYKTEDNMSFYELIERTVDMALTGLDNRSKFLKIPNERQYFEKYLENISLHGLPSIRRQKSSGLTNLK